MASPAWRIEAIEASSRSSMVFSPWPSSSSSSPEWVTGARTFRSPSCTAMTTRFSPLIDFSTRRLITRPPPMPRIRTMIMAPHRAWVRRAR
ncbi:hypothetical protein D3C80_1793650 [compost metagenome]